jgi:hypothetical protein
VLLHAAALEPRISSITIEDTLSTYRSVVDADVHRNVAEAVIPGVLLHYDLDDLLIAIAPRPVAVVGPVDGAGDALSQAAWHDQLVRVFTADRSLGFADRVSYTAAAAANAAPAQAALSPTQPQ